MSLSLSDPADTYRGLTKTRSISINFELTETISQLFRFASIISSSPLNMNTSISLFYDCWFSSIKSSLLGKDIEFVNSSLTRPVFEILPSLTSGGRLPSSSFSVAAFLANSFCFRTFAKKSPIPESNFWFRGTSIKYLASYCSVEFDRGSDSFFVDFSTFSGFFEAG